MRRLTQGLIVLGIVAIGGVGLMVRGHRGKAVLPTDFETDVARIDRSLAGEDEKGRRPYLLYQRALLTGEPADFRTARNAIDDAIAHTGMTDELRLLRGMFDFRFHHLQQAHEATQFSPEPAGFAADIAFEQGRYDDARRGYEAAVRGERTWDSLARLANFLAKSGDPDGADAMFAQAAEEITVKEMRAYAWVQIQRGLLSLRRGRYEEAAGHYELARRAYSGDWLIDEHLAELLAARGKFDDAVSLYQKVLARLRSPSIQRQLGDLYAHLGRPDLAKPWHDAALAGYLESVERGEVHHFHDLAGFYADVRPDGAESLKWATRDAELRPNYMTQDALAWALYRAGQIPEALAASDGALASGMSEAHLMYHAAIINQAAGRLTEAQRLLKRTFEINPRYNDFHVHR